MEQYILESRYGLRPKPKHKINIKQYKIKNLQEKAHRFIVNSHIESCIC